MSASGVIARQQFPAAAVPGWCGSPVFDTAVQAGRELRQAAGVDQRDRRRDETVARLWAHQPGAS